MVLYTSIALLLEAGEVDLWGVDGLLNIRSGDIW